MLKDMIVDPTKPYTYSQLMRDILALKSAYPKLVTDKNAGFSVEGRQLPVVMLGTGRKKVFICGAHHAREYISSAYLMYTINEYAKAASCGKKYGSYDMTKLFKECKAYFMPMVNPDGIRLVQGGLKAVQHPEHVESMIMVKSTYAEWKANVNGVDLNRHYPALWEHKNVEVAAPASESFNGEEAATEPEVRAVMRICKKNHFKAALSFHTKGKVIYYADANTNEKILDANQIAKRMAVVSDYQLMPVSEDPGIYAAGFENWFRQQFLYPGLLVELTPSTGGTIPHKDKEFFTLVWDDAKYICAEFIKAVLEN